MANDVAVSTPTVPDALTDSESDEADTVSSGTPLTSSDCDPNGPSPTSSVSPGGSGWLRSMFGRTAPGTFLLGKLDRFKQRRRESSRRRVTEKELRRLNRKIEKLLTRLDDVEVQPEVTPLAEDEECVICLSAPATMQTFPCAHRVACRRCFVRTIQTAIAERSLPLRCVVCRSRILKLNDPIDPSPFDHSRRASSIADYKMAATALPAIDPLLVRSSAVQRGDKMAAVSGGRGGGGGGGKTVERRLTLHRRQ